MQYVKRIPIILNSMLISMMKEIFLILIAPMSAFQRCFETTQAVSVTGLPVRMRVMMSVWLSCFLVSIAVGLTYNRGDFSILCVSAMTKAI